MACTVSAVDGATLRLLNEAGESVTARTRDGLDLAAGDPVILMVRRENIELDAAPGADFDGLHATVDEVVFTGATVMISARLGDGSTLAISVRPGQALPEAGAAVGLTWAPDAAVVVV